MWYPTLYLLSLPYVISYSLLAISPLCDILLFTCYLSPMWYPTLYLLSLPYVISYSLLAISPLCDILLFTCYLSPMWYPTLYLLSLPYVISYTLLAISPLCDILLFTCYLSPMWYPTLYLLSLPYVISYSLLAISPLCDIILRTFRFLTPKQFNCFSPNFRLGARVPDDGYSRKTSLWITFYIKLYVLSLIQIYTFCHWYRFIRFVIDTDLYVLSLIQTYTFCHWYRLIRFVIDADTYISFNWWYNNLNRKSSNMHTLSFRTESTHAYQTKHLSYTCFVKLYFKWSEVYIKHKIYNN